MRTFFIILALALFFGKGISAHPVHVSISNLEFAGEEPLISVKLFKDDLQLAIYHNYSIEIPLDQIGNEEHADIILKYLLNKFIIKLNKNKELRLEYRNSETNEEAIWIYFSTNVLPQISNITIINSIFLDIYHDQTNLLIVNYSGKQKGYRFDIKVDEIEISL